jgi:hypothetical protein
LSCCRSHTKAPIRNKPDTRSGIFFIWFSFVIGSDKDCPSELNAFDGCQIQATLEFGGGKLGCRTGQGDQILCRNIEQCLNVVMTENLAIAQQRVIFAGSSMFPYLPLRGLQSGMAGAGLRLRPVFLLLLSQLLDLLLLLEILKPLITSKLI